MLYNRLKKRFSHLKKWARKNGIGAFRLYDRDIPEIPLVMDFYGGSDADGGCPRDAAICCSLYKRPYEKDETDEGEWLRAMKDSASSALGVRPERVFIKQRQKQRGVSQYEKLNEFHSETIITEGGLSFKINLSDYLDTGLFIDRRLLREMTRSESKDKRVLNLFSYTGSFSVYAASGAAVSTDSVDISNTYLNWAMENFALNGFKAELVKNYFSAKPQSGGRELHADSSGKPRGYFTSLQNPHKLIRCDALEFIKKAIEEKMRWDVIIADPPAFSNSKKMTDVFDLNRDLTELLIDCLSLLAPGGKIFLSVNSRRGVPSADDIEKSLRGLTPALNSRVTDLSRRIADEDFKGKKIPKAFLVNLV